MMRTHSADVLSCRLTMNNFRSPRLYTKHVHPSNDYDLSGHLGKWNQATIVASLINISVSDMYVTCT